MEENDLKKTQLMYLKCVWWSWYNVNSSAFSNSLEHDYMRINWTKLNCWRTRIQHMFWIHLKCSTLKASRGEVFKVHGVEAFLRLFSSYFGFLLHISVWYFIQAVSHTSTSALRFWKHKCSNAASCGAIEKKANFVPLWQ